MVRRTQKAKKGSGLLGLAGLATAAAASPGQSKMNLGPGYLQSIPNPARNGRLMVHPTPTPTPSAASMQSFTMKNGTRHTWVNTKAHAYEPVWSKSNSFVPGAFSGAFDPKEGTRWRAPPEVQTWNPYLRGDPKEIVDYYEGYGAADKARLVAADKEAGLIREQVPRKDTPMWKAAQSWSVHLPPASTPERRSLLWESFADQGRKLGMNVPMKDPRIYKKGVNAKWLNVPESVDNEVLAAQLYHHGLKPLAQYNGNPLSGMRNIGRSNMSVKGSKPAKYLLKTSNLGKNSNNLWSKYGSMTGNNIAKQYKWEENTMNNRKTKKNNYGSK